MMAAATSWQAKVLCRFYQQGKCSKGDRCPFSHQSGSIAASSICHFYQLGKCSHGKECRYDHVRTKDVPVSQQPVQLGSTKERFGSKLTPLRKQGLSADSGLGDDLEVAECSAPSRTYNPKAWTAAAEFVPGKSWTSTNHATPCVSYTSVAQTGVEPADLYIPPQLNPCEGAAAYPTKPSDDLCPFSSSDGVCPYAERCLYTHPTLCEYCDRYMLHPSDEKQRNEHTETCMKQVEEDMELSFAVQRSASKQCGICLEVVMDKKPSHEARFGILSKCNHVFCLECIRKWRAAKSYKHTTVRACPECRTKSDFVTPSKYWIEDEKQKEKLIESYKGALSKKPCKYFKQGEGECPFNDSCFYKHAYPDGRPASPRPRRPRKRRVGANNFTEDGEIEFADSDLLDVLLADFVQNHIERSFGGFHELFYGDGPDSSPDIDSIMENFLYHELLQYQSSDSDDDDFFLM